MCVYLTLGRWTSVMKGNSSGLLNSEGSAHARYSHRWGRRTRCHGDGRDIYRSVATPIHSVDASLSPYQHWLQQFAECAPKYLLSAIGNSGGFVKACDHVSCNSFLPTLPRSADPSKLRASFVRRKVYGGLVASQEWNFSTRLWKPP